MTGSEIEEERHASWLELFFDLVFVLVVGQDFVMLNALADTNAARGAITLATDTLRTALSDKT
jgi:low temperature requirement protein LtrA